MQAILTKYLSATNTRNARIKAFCQAGSKTIPFPDLDTDEAHLKAAYALAHDLGWTDEPYGKLAQGGLPDGTGYCHVFVKGKTPKTA